MRLVWINDIHLNFVAPERKEQLYSEIAEPSPDAVLVGGDIGESKSFVPELVAISDAVGVPVYFVLGNHDYYRGSIRGCRQLARSLADDPSNTAVWLPEAGTVRLTDRTALVGHGGWGDGRAGDFFRSNVVLNDYLLIDELHRATTAQADLLNGDPLPPSLYHRLNILGDEAADHFRSVLPDALAEADHVYVLMHVPPFHETCWHEGRLSDDNWAPHFVCQAAGNALRDIMAGHPDRRLTVLCGHTHGAGKADILPNLHVITGGAVYREPAVQQVFDVG